MEDFQITSFTSLHIFFFQITSFTHHFTSLHNFFSVCNLHVYHELWRVEPCHFLKVGGIFQEFNWIWQSRCLQVSQSSTKTASVRSAQLQTIWWWWSLHNAEPVSVPLTVTQLGKSAGSCGHAPSLWQHLWTAPQRSFGLGTMETGLLTFLIGDWFSSV